MAVADVPRPPGQLALLLAETTLAGVTVAAIFGLIRIFDDASFFVPLALTAVAAHGAASLVRRDGRPVLVGVALVAGGLVALLTWLKWPETTLYGVPTTDSWAAASDELTRAWEVFRNAAAPAPVAAGFLVVGVLVVAVVAVTADTAAFRANARIEAVVPAISIFVFGAALGGGRHRLVTTAVFLAALLAYWLGQRGLAQSVAPGQLATDPMGAGTSLARAGLGLIAIGLVAAVVIGPMLPGADARAVIPWRASDRADAGTRVTVSPLVDIRTRLVDQADTVAFSVGAESASYWRLTSLDQFDGRIWSSKRRYESADDALRQEAPRGSEVVTQSVLIGDLSSVWLPAAYQPIDVSGIDAAYDAESASLVAEGADPPEEGTSYLVRSVRPDVDPEALADVAATAPAAIATTNTALPEGFSTRVQELAGQIVGPDATQYEKARRLQDYFRDGSFTYDLTVSSGHATDDLERFLFDSRTGYCEQFAGAYAAMARAVGLPARVAVGFTPGQLGEDGRYQVRGYNAHAWPEVYFEGVGWVAFEPTPGRGIPGASDYTGVSAQQPTGPEFTTTTLDPSVTTAPADPTATTLPDFGGDLGTTGAVVNNRRGAWKGRFALAGLVVGVGAVLWPLGLLGLRRWLRRRRRARANDPSGRVIVAWDDVVAAADEVGTHHRDWETPAEYARRAARAPGVDPRLVTGLAGMVTYARYAASGVDPALATRAEEAAASITAGVEATFDRSQRIRRWYDPRPLLPRRQPRIDIREQV